MSLGNCIECSSHPCVCKYLDKNKPISEMSEIIKNKLQHRNKMESLQILESVIMSISQDKDWKEE